MARWRVLLAGEFGDAEEDDPLELRQLPRQAGPVVGGLVDRPRQAPRPLPIRFLPG
ncbi:hypothetical protein ACF09Z_37340 [Streptomyces erythrochromogenes]|uniref:hypothetical protein n=1 Tax=Streptomyces erythrochromogenes TaxID=285574 RepID=UPI0036F9B34C